MQVDIITPERVVFSDLNSTMVTVPGVEGQMGILDSHAPTITFLRPGVISVEGSEKKYFFTTGGVLDFKGNNLNILSQEIFDIQNLSNEKISELKSRAMQDIENSKSDNDTYLANTLLQELNNLATK
jgi:F-type H+-transporting ATPase subunit epsilon